MLRQLYEAIKQILLLTHKTDQNREEIKDLRRQVREIASALERLAYEVHRLGQKVDHSGQNETHEREKLALHLKNELLKFELRLPPAKQDDERKDKK